MGKFKNVTTKIVQLTGLFIAVGTIATEVHAGTANLSSISASPSAAVSGQLVTATVRMTDKCPSSGCTVSLRSNSAAAVVPTSLFIPKDATSRTFTFTAGNVSTKTAITLSAIYGGSTKTTGTSFSISPAGATAPAPQPAPALSLQSVSFDRSAGLPGESNAVSFVLSGSCPTSSCVISLSSSHPNVVAVPASVTINQGAISGYAGFTQGTPSVTNTVVTVTAQLGASSRSANYTANLPVVTAPPAGSYAVSAYGSMNLSSSTVYTDAYGYEQATRQLNSPTAIPQSIMAVYEQCRLDFPGLGQLTAVGTNVKLPVTTDAYNKWYRVRQDFTCSPGPYSGWMASFTATSNAGYLQVGASSAAQICLTEAAPAGGVIIKMTANSAAAGIPASITIPAGSVCGNFSIVAKSASGGTVKVYASQNGFVREVQFNLFY